MTTGQKIYECRRKAGMTQEELAEKLGVTRQAVSKWESDVAFPETEKILELCKMFRLSADELLFGDARPQEDTPAEESEKEEQSPPTETRACGWLPHEGKLHYEYVSKTRLFGMPLVHVNFGLGVYRAKGVIAIGNVATGFVSLGLVSVGLVSLGVVAVGLLAFGTLALALLLGAGAIALGALAFGGIAVGVLAFGGLTVGYIAVGGMAVGQFAMGGGAQGWLAVGHQFAHGTNAFVVPESLPQLDEFVDANVGGWLASFVKGVARTLNG